MPFRLDHRHLFNRTRVLNELFSPEAMVPNPVLVVNVTYFLLDVISSVGVIVYVVQS